MRYMHRYNNINKTTIAIDLDAHHLFGSKENHRGFSEKKHRQEVVRKVKGYGSHGWARHIMSDTHEAVEPQVYKFVYNMDNDSYTCFHPSRSVEHLIGEPEILWVATLVGFESAHAKMLELQDKGSTVYYIGKNGSTRLEGKDDYSWMGDDSTWQAAPADDTAEPFN